MLHLSLRINGIKSKTSTPLSVPFRYREGSIYFISVDTHPLNTSYYKQYECIMRIDEKTSEDRIIEGHSFRFFNKYMIEWRAELRAERSKGNALLYLEFPDCEFDVISIDCQIIAFNLSMVLALEISDKKQKLLKEAVELYVNDNYRDSINRIGNLGEHIAKKLALKIKNNKKNFRGAINALVHIKNPAKKRINYHFLASHLWPIYYARNEQAHPNSGIFFDRSLNETLLMNLEQIIKYLANEGIIIDKNKN